MSFKVPRSGYPCMGDMTSIRANSRKPLLRIASENPCRRATSSNGNRQHSENARARASSESVPVFALRIAWKAGSKRPMPTSSAALRQESRSKITAITISIGTIPRVERLTPIKKSSESSSLYCCQDAKNGVVYGTGTQAYGIATGQGASCQTPQHLCTIQIYCVRSFIRRCLRR